MNPILFVIRRPIITALLVMVLTGGGVFAMHKLRVDVPALNTPKIYAKLDDFGVRASQVKDWVVQKYESWFHKKDEKHHQEQQKIVVSTPKIMPVEVTQRYVCQIRSQRHIEVCAIESGYLDKILIKEGQTVKEGDVLFRIVPTLYQARLDAENAEAELARLEFMNTERLYNESKVVSQNEVKLFAAKLARARAKADLAQAELNFTDIRAKYDGIVDRLAEREGSLIKEGDVLTTLSDNSLMWVYFNVPEREYLEYMAHREQHEREDKIELILANQDKFPQAGKIGAIEAKFNNETGNIAFRADFPNPDRLLRHGQTGNILIHRTVKNALVIPQRATFEVLDKRYVWVVGENDIAKQTLITIKHELEDIFVINDGIGPNDKIVVEGVRLIEDGGKVEYEFEQPEEILKNLKFRAE